MIFLKEIHSFIGLQGQISSNELKESALRCSEYAFDAAQKIEYVEELKKRAMTIFDHNKFIKNYYLDKTQRLQLSSWLCYFTYLIPSLFLSVLLAVIVYQYVSVVQGKKALSKKVASQGTAPRAGAAASRQR